MLFSTAYGNKRTRNCSKNWQCNKWTPFGGQSLHSPVLKVQLHVYDFCIICFALLRDVICLALGPKQGPPGPLQTLPCLWTKTINGGKIMWKHKSVTPFFTRFPNVTTAVLKSVCLNEVHGTEAHDILCEDDLESTLIGNKGILGISSLPFGLSREIRSFNTVVSYIYFRPELKEKLH